MQCALPHWYRCRGSNRLLDGQSHHHKVTAGWLVEYTSSEHTVHWYCYGCCLLCKQSYYQRARTTRPSSEWVVA